jgi:hypothetical protein
VLYLDLDVMVIASIDSFFEFGSNEDVVLARNPNTPFERLGQTSVFRFPVGKLRPLQEIFQSDPQAVANTYYYEQRFVTRNAPGGAKFFPRKWVAHFRMDCVPWFPLNYLIEPKRPKRASIVIFPGGLNQELAIEGRWSKATATLSRRQFISNSISSKRGWSFVRQIRHFLLPSTWVRRDWIE